MNKILAITGYSNAGKTTLIERLIPILIRAGYRVGLVKNDAHGLQFDREGKDTDRFYKAGAATVAAISPEQYFVYGTSTQFNLEDAQHTHFKHCNLILAEGFKNSPYPKIEVNYSLNRTPLLDDKITNIIAVVSDRNTGKKQPHFKFDQLESLALFISEYFRFE